MKAVTRFVLFGILAMTLFGCEGNSSMSERDNEIPILTLLGNTTITLQLGDAYSDAGATAYDDFDGDISDKIQVTNPVDTNTAGTYAVVYRVSDEAGNAAKELERKVIVLTKHKCENEHSWKLSFDEDPTSQSSWVLREGKEFDETELDNGVWKTENKLLDTTPKFAFDQPTAIHLLFRNTSIGGKGAVFWINADFTESESTSIHTSLTLQADNTQTLTLYSNAGSEVELAKFDNLPLSFIDMWLTLEPTKNEVSIWIEGVFKGTFVYQTHDRNEDQFATLTGWGSKAEFDSIEIESCSNGTNHPEKSDTTPPTITLNGPSEVYLAVDATYLEEGATAVDNVDGEVEVTISGKVDTSKKGQYTVTYSAKDSAKNSASIDRKVYVEALPEVDCTQANIVCVGSGKKFKKIQAAIDASKSGDTVVVFPGIYREAVSINKDNIIVKSLTNKGAIISGEKAVESWKYDTTLKLFHADSPCEDVQSLFVKGIKMKSSRYPDSGYLEFNNVANTQNKFSVKGFNLQSPQDSIAHIRTSHWRLSSRRIGNYDGNHLTLKKGVDGDISTDYKVFFTQALGNIKQENEWAWNSNQIYIKSTNEPVNVSVACNSYGIAFSDEARKVEVSGFHITRIKGDGIRFTNLEKRDGKEEINRRRCDEKDDYYIHDNQIDYTDQWGLNFANVCEDKGKSRFENNEISHTTTGGIRASQVHDLLIKNNFLHDIMTSKYDDDVLASGEYGMGSGVLILSSGGAHIIQNKLQNVGYCGINLINYERYHGNRIVEQNYVSNAMQGLNDGACIYTHVALKEENGIVNERDIIRNNIVENCTGSFAGTIKYPFPQGMGIYLDDYSSQIDVLDNTVIGSAKNLYLHDATDIKIENNTFVNATQHSFLLGNRKSIVKKVSFNNNLIVALLTSEIWEYHSGANRASDSLRSDRNVFRGKNTAKMFKILSPGRYNYEYISFDDWKSFLGTEANSKMIVDEKEAVVMINPSLSDITFNKLQGCKKADTSSMGDSAILPSFASLVVFGCSNYAPGVHKKSK